MNNINSILSLETEINSANLVGLSRHAYNGAPLLKRGTTAAVCEIVADNGGKLPKVGNWSYIPANRRAGVCVEFKPKYTHAKVVVTGAERREAHKARVAAELAADALKWKLKQAVKVAAQQGAELVAS